MNYNQIVGYNIRSKRETFHETQKNLADSLKIKENTLSNYELGKRAIPFKHLVFIANRYASTIDSFFIEPEVYEEQQINNIELNIKAKDFVEYVKAFFPIACSEEALKDGIFKKAYYKHRDMFSKITVKSNIPVESAINCYKIYNDTLSIGEFYGAE